MRRKHYSRWPLAFPKRTRNLISAAIATATNSTAFKITCDKGLLKKIQSAYADVKFCTRLLQNRLSTLGIKRENDLLFLGERLVIPRSKGLRELFCGLAHDSLGHSGAKKSYATLRQSYYWPGMRKGLENSYIPGCEDCQHNKNSTEPPTGPLHPLPIADQRGDRTLIDFVSPLPEDRGFNYLCTITDQLNSSDC